MPRLPGFRRSLFAGLLIILGTVSADDRVVVVIDAQNDVERLTREEAINIFLGRFRRLPNGQAAIPIDRPKNPDLMADFYRLLVDKDLAEIRSYWSRLIFSGKTPPPRPSESIEDLLDQLSNTAGAIGYMRPHESTARLRVILTLEP